MAKLGKSKAPSKKSASTDWATSIGEQHIASQQVKDVIVKTLPVKSIKPDEDNPRSLAISAEEIQAFVAEFPFSIESLERSARNYVDAYVEQLERHSGLSGKALGDFIAVVEFAASLKHAEGLIQPIAVWREGTQFHLIVGERRWLAHNVLNAPTIAARIYQQRPAQIDIDRMQWDENEARERMNLWDRLCRVEKMIKGYYSLAEASKTTLATLIGKSPSEAARYLAVLRCKHPTLKKAIQEGRVNNLTQAEKLASKSHKEILAALAGEKPKKTTSTVTIHSRSKLSDVQHFLTTVASACHCEHILKDKPIVTHKNCAEVMSIMIAVLAKQAATKGKG